MDIDYGAVFGLGESGEELTEVAEPSAGEEAQGENEQEAAEPAEEDSKEEPESVTGPGDTGEPGTPGTEEQKEKPKQTPEENARYAAARRKAEAERDAAIAKAKKDAKKEAQQIIEQAFKASGLVNPYTKQPITTKAEYDEYREQFESEKRKNILKKSGMSDDEFRQFVENLPEVRQAREAQAKAEAAEKEARKEQAKSKIEEQLREIRELDPTIQGIEDLSKMENYPKFYELVKRGNTLTDAFKLANYDALTREAVNASRQAAIQTARSKQHLRQTAARGQGEITVPKDIRDAYLTFNPGATAAEIQAHYKNYLKNGKE